MAEVGIWNAALTDAEVAILALGYSPDQVRPASLVEYWKLIGRNSPETGIKGYDMTLYNAPLVANHPRIIYPCGPQTVYKPTAAAGGLSIPVAMAHYRRRRVA
jgi:hypothetical protein